MKRGLRREVAEACTFPSQQQARHVLRYKRRSKVTVYLLLRELSLNYGHLLAMALSASIIIKRHVILRSVLYTAKPGYRPTKETPPCCAMPFQMESFVVSLGFVPSLGERSSVSTSPHRSAAACVPSVRGPFRPCPFGYGEMTRVCQLQARRPRSAACRS